MSRGVFSDCLESLEFLSILAWMLQFSDKAFPLRSQVASIPIKTHTCGSDMINSVHLSRGWCLETKHGIKRGTQHWIVSNVNNLCHILIMIYRHQSAFLELAAKAEIQ